MRRSLIVPLLSLCTLAPIAPAGAQGWILPRRCGLATARPLTIRAPGTSPLRAPADCRPSIVRTRSDVRVTLVGQVLRYEVDERFVNRGGTVGEADYLFPIPANAAFHDLKLSINGELTAGETMNAAEARRIYENIVRARRDPALVEWMGHGLLHARIFPIEPGEEKRVIVRFERVAPREGDAYRIDYFRGADQGPAARSNQESSSFELTYRQSPELGTPYSPTHTLDLSERDGARVVTVHGDARDLTLLVPVRHPATAAISVLPYAPGNEDGFALITVSPPARSRGDRTPRDVTLVLDVSGSMHGRKMTQARAAGRQLLATLSPQDRFRLIDFSSDVRTFRDEFIFATTANLRAAGEYLDALDASGGTNIEGALREAVRPSVTTGRLPLVLFITDGEPTIGEGRPDRLAAICVDASARAGTPRRIFTFGLGSDVNVTLLEQLALDGRGTAEFVRPGESVERTVGIVVDRLVDPVLTDVRIRVDGGIRLAGILPATASDIFADRDLVMFARYSGHGPAHVTVTGHQGGEPVSWSTSAVFPERDRQSAFVARLWAAHRVGYLSAERRKNGPSAELDEELRTLGERYGIPTEVTSYLVAEPRKAMARRAAIDAAGPRPSAVPAPAPRGVAFESARTAAAQRAVRSVAVMDSLMVPRAVRDRAENAVTTRRVGARVFTLRDSVWTDDRVRPDMPPVQIKAFSQAYFDLLAGLPDLRTVFALGDRVVVAGRDRAIVLGATGQETLSRAALAALVDAW